MRVRSRTPLLATLAALAATNLGAQQPEQQVGGRFEVLVPDFQALDGADRDFGEDAAEALRALVGTLATHQAIERREIQRALRQLDLDMKDLDCPRTVQLGRRMGVQVALCASYTEGSDGRYQVAATFWDVASGESLAVDPTSGGEHDDALVARHIFDRFDRYTSHLRAAAGCAAYTQSSQWQEALTRCDEALALNPDAVGVRQRRARSLYELGRGEEALDELGRVLDADPVRGEALQLAGYVAATLDRRDEAHDYYARYLQLDPANAAVRMRVAYDLALAGDPSGALELIQEGVAGDSANVELWEQLGGYAFTVGESINRTQPSEDAGGLAPAAVEYYREAVDAYRRVYAARGSETSAAHLRSMVVALVRLGDAAGAAAIGTEAVDAHPDEATLWSVYADALRRASRLEEALTALSRVEAIDPAYPNLGLRQGAWLVEAGRLREAVDVLKEVAAAEPERADAAARLVLADAHAQGVQNGRYDYAIETIELARELPNLSDDALQQLNFWQGYAVLRDAMEEQEPRTLESARATLPRFREALELLEDVGEYPATVGVGIGPLRDNVRTFIEIQEAIIRRGSQPGGIA